MDIYKGITQLNTLISSYNKSVKFFKKDFDCKILFGDYLFELNDILTKVSPFGNVCFISKKSTFEKFIIREVCK